MVFGDLPINDAIILYFEKHDALNRGDFIKLKEMREQYPQLFLPQTEHEIQSLLNYIAKLRRDPAFQQRYKSFCKAKLKEKLTVIMNSDS